MIFLILPFKYGNLPDIREIPNFYAPAASVHLWHRAFGLSEHAYVHLSTDQVKIFVQGRISRPVNGSKFDISYEDVSLWDQREYTRVMTSWPIFHSPLTSDFDQIIKVKIFIQSRILRSTNGSKLIFHMKMHLYETNRNIQEP